MRRFVLGEFDEPYACVEAVRQLRDKGVSGLDAYSAHPLPHVDEALGLPRSKVPIVAFAGGVLGALGGYWLQAYLNGVAYPINVGNRPPHGFWTNIPITFECGVLLSVLSIFFSAIFGFFQLPRTYHPVFESERFRTASLDKCWVSAETTEESAVLELERKFREVGAHKVHSVEETA
jgi:Protein of unknown function (DUF3341)